MTTISNTGPYGNPSIQRIAAVASALGDGLAKRVVFIGGAIMPLLQVDQAVFATPRATKDVDGVVHAMNYTQKGGIEEQLRARGFKNAMKSTHLDRWIAPNGETFDLVSCGSHLGGTGNKYDLYAIESSETIELPPVVRHASAVGFLALKFAAFGDRGRENPLGSKDLADLVTLLATRPALASELQSAPDHIQALIRERAQAVLADRRAISSLATHIAAGDPLIDNLEETVVKAFDELARERARPGE